MTYRDRMALKPIASDVARLNVWLDDAFPKAGMAGQAAADLKLCVNEAVANLVSYAFDGTVAPTIVIEIELDRKLGKAVVLDNGEHFDVRQWPLPKRPQSLESTRPGGFGIALIRWRANRIDYERDGDLNRLTIVCSGVSP
jgi:serine/threonine-protein kinase RsbW